MSEHLRLEPSLGICRRTVTSTCPSRIYIMKVPCSPCLISSSPSSKALSGRPGLNTAVKWSCDQREADLSGVLAAAVSLRLCAYLVQLVYSGVYLKAVCVLSHGVLLGYAISAMVAWQLHVALM